MNVGNKKLEISLLCYLRILRFTIESGSSNLQNFSVFTKLPLAIAKLLFSRRKWSIVGDLCTLFIFNMSAVPCSKIIRARNCQQKILRVFNVSSCFEAHTRTFLCWLVGIKIKATTSTKRFLPNLESRGFLVLDTFWCFSLIGFKYFCRLL